MENKFKGFYLDKEGKNKASSNEINNEVEVLKDPFITLKMSAQGQIDLQRWLKFEKINNGVTFYGKFEPEQ